MFTECIDARNSGLENVIVMTFSLSALMKRDKSVWIANHLNQALGQLSEEGRRGFRSRATTFVERIAKAVPSTDVRAGFTPETVGNMVWITVHGCHLLSDAVMDDVFARLAESWRMPLPAMVPAESLPYFERFLAGTVAQFQTPAPDEFTGPAASDPEPRGEEAR